MSFGLGLVGQEMFRNPTAFHPHPLFPRTEAQNLTMGSEYHLLVKGNETRAVVKPQFSSRNVTRRHLEQIVSEIQSVMLPERPLGPSILCCPLVVFLGM